MIHWNHNILFISFFLNILLTNCILNNNNDEKLLFVWEHFRHGARGPYRSFDEVNWRDLLNEKWNGEGELTSLGMRMHYLLGVSTKNKYFDFLSKEYNPNEILVKSTDVNRTILSSYSTLQGIYNSSTFKNLTEKQIKTANIQNYNNSDLINQKIKELENNAIEGGYGLYPVHIYPTNYDHQFQIYRTDECPGIKSYLDEIRNKEEIKKMCNDTSAKINDTYGEFIYKFMNISGIENPYYLFDFSNLFSIADTFIADYYNGRELKIVNDTGINMTNFYNDCLNISFIDSYYRQFGYPVSKLLYFGVSPVFRTFFNYTDMRIILDKAGETDKIVSGSPRFVLNAGHDSSLGANDLFLKTEFNISFKRAEYSHSQIYELWRINGSYFIKYLVNHEEIKTFDYNVFKNNVLNKLYTPEQISKICNGEMNLISLTHIKKESKLSITIFYITSGFILFSLVGIFFQQLYHHKNKRKSLKINIK